jgi:hypothetical protein
MKTFRYLSVLSILCLTLIINIPQKACAEKLKWINRLMVNGQIIVDSQKSEDIVGFIDTYLGKSLEIKPRYVFEPFAKLGFHRLKKAVGISQRPYTA